MKSTIRVCLFFKEPSMSVALRRFFTSQQGCVITDFFSDNRSISRDIRASRPHLVIIQNTLIRQDKRVTLQRVFPNTVIATWVDSRFDQAKMNELLGMAQEKALEEFDYSPIKENRGELRKSKSLNNHLLTYKETQVLQLLADGHSYESVCNELLIGYETLRTHIQHLYAKLEVKHVNEAIAKARKEKLVQ
jgi:ATP/maltotriose-dependent transcriptional regulator MalT